MIGNLVHILAPTEDNPRNSEGAFLRAANGDILFAYSRYTGTSYNDHASCDIALLRSSDEGESWRFDGIIARRKDLDCLNLMSVSALTHNDGRLSFYFLVKENDGSSTVAKCTSTDGISFDPSSAKRVTLNAPHGYYVINNDRFVRLTDGRIIAPAAYYPSIHDMPAAVAMLLVSEDDGESFSDSGVRLESAHTVNSDIGLEEPGIIETESGLFMWFRTSYGCQYFSTSSDLKLNFTDPLPSQFTSPRSPMQIKCFDGVYYAVYNPVPNYNGRVTTCWGRTPIVIRKSADNESYGELNILEDDSDRGYCYPAIFKTNDDSLLLSYCRGKNTEDGVILANTGIHKIALSDIK